MNENNQVLEGFICPMCMTDFKTPNYLTKHFEEFHNDDPEILKSLKDIFGKAKKKILKNDETLEPLSPASPISHSHKNVDINWGPQEIGQTKSYTSYFREVRNVRMERYSSETNKLLIRLDKLLYNIPSNPVDRKVHEQTIVPWIDEKDVKLCPSCAKSFHVARRKHHCRLCGTVMCNNCTMFLSLMDARKMTSPVSIQDDSLVSRTSEHLSPGRFIRAGIGLAKLGRSPSSSSLNSVLSLVHDSPGREEHLRLCTLCMSLLEAREKLKLKQFNKPVVHHFHEKMRDHIQEAIKHLIMYNKMWESLREGETTYNLQDAQTLRMNIAKVGENIDLISKKILLLNAREDNEASPPNIEIRLHQTIRSAAVTFLKEQIVGIPALPNEEEYKLLQEERDKRIQARIMYEKKFEEEQKEMKKEYRNKEIRNAESPISNKINQPQLVLDQSQGWGPSTVTPVMSSMDPIVEQMSNLRAYIKQARADCRFDEVAILENNLKELQSAYFSMKQSDIDGG